MKMFKLVTLGCLLAILSVQAQSPNHKIPGGNARLVSDHPLARSTRPPVPLSPSTSCPVLACTLELIPEQCREIPKFDHNGIQCSECPKWRPGCESGGNSNKITENIEPRVSCPYLACDTYVPVECRVIEKFAYRGQMCQKCPLWRKGCREADRITTVEGNPETRQPHCPEFQCDDNNIPLECTINQPYEYHGRTCYRCPMRSPTCASQPQDPLRPLVNQPEVSCPLMQCARLDGYPSDCYQHEVFNYRGKLCQGCPNLKTECQQFIPPRPIVQVDPVTPVRAGNTETPCPLMQCRLIYIPEECKETPTFSFNGKICQGCPEWRDGCIPKMTGPAPPNPNTDFPRIPEIQAEVTCPVKACVMIHIPAECREDRQYQYKGITCYDCPKWKESCLNSGGELVQPQSTKPEVSCPMFGCPMIYIPPECREEQTFQFHGKTCHKCPRWRDGCVPVPPKPNVISTNPVLPTLPTVEDSVSMLPEISCPLMACTRILIPPECRTEQPYEHHGKTCYRCPKWKDGCLGRGQDIQTATASPEKVEPSTHTAATIDASKVLKPANSPSISDLKEVIPLTNILNTVNKASCPPLRCPNMVIPLECREESTYQYQGRVCKGCPRWRLGCHPMTGETISSNPNGLLSFSLFNELFAH